MSVAEPLFPHVATPPSPVVDGPKVIDTVGVEVVEDSPAKPSNDVERPANSNEIIPFASTLRRVRLLEPMRKENHMTPNLPTTVADVMTRKIVTITEEEAIDDVDRGMHRMRFRHLPVVDGDGTLVGLLSHGDLLHASASSLSDSEAERNELILQQPVRRIMQRELLTVQPEDSLIEAGKVLWKSKIGCLPVVKADGTLVGMLTKSDFIRVALQLLGSELKPDDVEQLAKVG